MKMSLIKYLALILLIGNALGSGCVFNLPSGKTVDLSAMTLNTGVDYSIIGPEQYTYIANVCKESSTSCGYDGSPVASMFTPDGFCVAALGRDLNGPGLSLVAPTLKETENGVSLKYGNGDICEFDSFSSRSVTY
jgi:hypothetical protein